MGLIFQVVLNVIKCQISLKQLVGNINNNFVDSYLYLKNVSLIF
jgi:hypothetical protein